jgi:hypothetical protein
MPTATLTEVLTRSMNGPDRAGQPHATAPPRPPIRPIDLDYPKISTVPEYKVEADKLNRFGRQQEEAAAKLVDLQRQLEQLRKQADRTNTDENAISKAEALLAGEEAGVNLPAEIQATAKLIEALRNAMHAQHSVLRRVNQSLSQAAGRRYEEEHKKRVRRLMTALDEVYAANEAELALRHDLMRLGYDGSSLPAMNLRTVEDPHDRNGNITYYWYCEADRYSETPEQTATEARKLRLRTALAE